MIGEPVKRVTSRHDHMLRAYQFKEAYYASGLVHDGEQFWTVDTAGRFKPVSRSSLRHDIIEFLKGSWWFNRHGWLAPCTVNHQYVTRTLDALVFIIAFSDKDLIFANATEAPTIAPRALEEATPADVSLRTACPYVGND